MRILLTGYDTERAEKEKTTKGMKTQRICFFVKFGALRG
jgi:hypothetical protein